MLGWPAELVASVGDRFFFLPGTSQECKVSLIFVFDFEWELWPCTWASPWQQLALFGAPQGLVGLHCGVRLVTHGPAEPLPQAAARFGFWSAGERVLRQLARELGLRDLLGVKAWTSFLEGMVRHFHPLFDDMQVLQAIMLRAPEKETALQKLVEEEEFREYLLQQDREKFEKEAEEREKTKSQQKAFLNSLRPLRAKVVQQQQRLNGEMASEERKRGPVGYQGDTSTWTQELVNQWVPPGAHMHRDEFNKRWRIRWMFGSVSRSWASHGYVGSAIMCLRIAWESHTQCTDLMCDVPGIFPIAPGAGASSSGGAPAEAGAEPSQLAPPASVSALAGASAGSGRSRPKAAVKAMAAPAEAAAKGRGRGRGRAQAPALVGGATQRDSEPQVAPRPRPASSSSSSSSSSESSS